jgi:hypothetical protein
MQINLLALELRSATFATAVLRPVKGERRKALTVLDRCKRTCMNNIGSRFCLCACCASQQGNDDQTSHTHHPDGSSSDL